MGSLGFKIALRLCKRQRACLSFIDCKKIYYRLIKEGNISGLRDFLNSDTHFQEHLDSLLESDLKEWGALNFITSNISIEMQDLIHANLSDHARKIIREWADRAVRPHGDVLKLI